MLCVLAIIIIAASISIPMYQSMIADMHVSAAADMVRARLADARSNAMEQCCAWRFSVLPNTGVFQLAPDDGAAWTDVGSTPVDKDDQLRGDLPPDIIFGENASDVSNAKEGGAPGSGWHTVCVFTPDGRAQDDATLYFGKTGTIPMRVRVRSVTGAVAMEQAVVVMEDK